GGKERRPDVVVHPRRRQQRRLPDGEGRRSAPTDDRGRRRAEVEFQRTVEETRMFISNKHLSRRAVLRGIGATMALPFLEAMIPPGRAFAAGAGAAGRKLRFVALEMVHGAAGSTQFGIQKHLWAPEAVGSDFDLTPSVLSPLEPFRSALTVVSNI